MAGRLGAKRVTGTARRRGRGRAALVLLTSLLSVAAFGEPAPSLIAVPNAEDLALTADGRWVIASSMAPAMQRGGALYAVDVRTRAVHRLNAEHAVDDAGQTGAEACTAPVAAADFAPHGIALRAQGGSEQLLVVNHGGREAIEIFRVEAGSPPRLAWQGCIPLPPGAMGNAVAAAGDRVYATSMGRSVDGSAPAERWMGEVIRWTEATGWQAVPDGKLFSPNGLLVATGRTAEEDVLYVASWAGAEVVKLAAAGRGAGRTRTAVKLPFLPDNLRWDSDGGVLATGMRGSVEAVAACVMGKGPCDMPTTVAAIAREPLRLRCRREAPLAVGTVALPVGPELWLGPVQGESIRVVRNGADAWRCD